LLIIRPCYEEVTQCTASWVDEIIAHLDESGINYVDCKGEKATLNNIRYHIDGNSIKSVVFYGHGEYISGGTWFGQHREIILNIDDLAILKNKFVYDVSCCSGRLIGRRSVEQGTRCYVGYKDIFKFSTKEPIVHFFKKTANRLLKEMIKNRLPAEKAHEITKRYYQQIIEEVETNLLETKDFALGTRYIFAIFSLEENMKSLTIYGDRSFSLQEGVINDKSKRKRAG
jgi:hypothetical protein